ncbi:MAG TPA: NfeD family protein [Bryobacteraceae bacterium]|nr:NfeD family protein [Bryobacteraceae bacterium]
MTLETFYLIAFLVGFLLSAVSFFAGVAHVPGVHAHGHPVHAPKLGKAVHGRGGVSPFNFGTISAFLAWFGGTGFLLERYSNIWIFLGLFISIMSGLGGAAIVFWFLLKLSANEHPLDPADYQMVGVLGRVTSPIREQGTGELIYLRDGARCATPARSEDGSAIPRDTEVIVTRFERGIAYVRRWDELAEERI